MVQASGELTEQQIVEAVREGQRQGQTAMVCRYAQRVFAMWGANWSGKVKNLNIKELRGNQKLFKYHPRTVVE